ncbi:class I SAM-dependent methyltransferase [Nocardia sp. NBC_00416]|uniref:class I SAM-dependent methyltransferase n=1 Tax=Nocardia sp. NBC_00416 TaxID=2975991 RepID=UPI002E1D8D99
MTSIAASERLTLSALLEGQTAAHLVVAADDLGWWQQLMRREEKIVPTTGLQRALARALHRFGWLAPDGDGYRLTEDGHEIAFNRGFVRVTTRGWEPTFRQIGSAAATADIVPAQTDPDAVARGCTDIALRHPETLQAIAARVAQDTEPGSTVDLGCADGGRLQIIGEFGHTEQLIGVDIEAGVIDTARERLAGLGFADRVRLRAGSVQPGDELPAWLDEGIRSDVTTAMSFNLMHQLASDGGGIDAVLGAWLDWFPNVRRFVIGDVVRSAGVQWHEQPWFAPTFEIYHELTGVRVWRDDEYADAFASLGFRVAEHLDKDHEAMMVWIAER